MSETIQALKTVKERLGHNYTSYQLLSVLDNLIWRACAPMLKTTDFLDRIIANVISWSATNPRRKVSSLAKPRFNTYALAFLVADDPRLKLRILKRMRMERNILLYAIDRWITLGSDCGASVPSAHLVRALAITNHKQVWFAVRESKYWLAHAHEFKGMIIEKYYRHVMLEATGFYKQQAQENPHLKFELSEIAQNFLLAVNKAVDKCDAKQGTLTSYINNWLKDAKGNPNLRGEYGIAYTIPASQRRAMVHDKRSGAVNISVSIDDDNLAAMAADNNVEAELVRQDTIQRVRLLAKRADPFGLGRIALNIEEQLDDTELQQHTLAVGA